jgi:hypothetical protein
MKERMKGSERDANSYDFSQKGGSEQKVKGQKEELKR